MFEVRESESWVNKWQEAMVLVYIVRKYLEKQKRRKIVASKSMSRCNRLTGLFCWTLGRGVKVTQSYGYT